MKRNRCKSRSLYSNKETNDNHGLSSEGKYYFSLSGSVLQQIEKITLVITDMDGTSLDSKGEFNREYYKEVHQLMKEKSVVFAACTPAAAMSKETTPEGDARIVRGSHTNIQQVTDDHTFKEDFVKITVYDPAPSSVGGRCFDGTPCLMKTNKKTAVRRASCSWFLFAKKKLTKDDYKCKLYLMITNVNKERGFRMTTKEAAQISAAEWEVMRVVWTAEKTTSKEIGDVLNEKMNWKPATTKTLIGRLVKKGLLNTEAEGRRYVYSPAVSEAESLREASGDLLDHICNTKVGKTLAGMLEDATLSQEDIRMLEELLQEKKKTAPKELVCDCLPGQCDCHHEMKGA